MAHKNLGVQFGQVGFKCQPHYSLGNFENITSTFGICLLSVNQGVTPLCQGDCEVGKSKGTQLLDLEVTRLDGISCNYERHFNLTALSLNNTTT